MQIDGKLDEIVEYIASARTMPMSSSAMLNKGELTALIEELRDLLPDDLQAADAVLAEREAILEEARYNADRIMADARAEQAKLVADHEITAEARAERIRLLDAAQESADAIRKAVDAHVDAKLARLERAALALAETARTGRADLAAAAAYQPIEPVEPVDGEPDDPRRSALEDGTPDARFAPDAASEDRRFVPEVSGFGADRNGAGRTV